MRSIHFFNSHICKGSCHRVVICLGLFLLLPLWILAGCADDPGPVEETFEPEAALINDVNVAARTRGRQFEVYRGGEWEHLTLKGVNIGTALPGKYFTWFPSDREVYRGWLEAVSRLNANVIRIYTLLDPLFYRVFLEYNQSLPPEERIWLLQEVWPEEEVPNDDYFQEDYLQEYKQEIRYALDALHGAAEIPARRGRAYGNYSADVSPFVLGVLIGRELEPHEVLQTDELNPNRDVFDGRYVQAVKGSSATEVWLAKMCDYALEYAVDNYGWQYPVSFVSWPTLDPLDHPAEWEPDSEPYNDMAEVNPAHMEQGPANLAGFFGSYHIYPNYPDFMNNEPSYDEYRDEEGILRYGAYLQEFMEVHPPYPALVAEFGMATGLTTAHVHPHGFHHGGVDEVEQGEMTVRMMEAILREGYAGGVIFALMDEWVKKTWSTEPYMVPYERNVFWQNAFCPEQNYGQLAMEPAREPFLDQEVLRVSQNAPAGNGNPVPDASDNMPSNDAGPGYFKGLQMDHNEAFLFLGLETAWESGEALLPPGTGLLVGFNTAGSQRGLTELPLQDAVFPQGMEFVLLVTGEADPLFLVNSSYNRAEERFFSPPIEPKRPEEDKETVEAKIQWETIRPVVNRERIGEDGTVFPAIRTNQSILPRGNYDPDNEAYDSLAMAYFDEENNRIELRLPWALLNFTDPSTRRIMDDPGTYLEPPGRDQLQTAETEGISFGALLFSYDPGSHAWPPDAEKEYFEPGELPAEIMDFLPRKPKEANLKADLPHYTWDFWEEPGYREREKRSFSIISAYFKEIK